MKKVWIQISPINTLYYSSMHDHQSVSQELLLHYFSGKSIGELREEGWTEKEFYLCTKDEISGPTHKQLWMSELKSGIDCRIYSFIRNLNRLGFTTLFSCQDLNESKLIQVVIEKSKSLFFKQLLTRNKIEYEYAELMNGISFEFTEQEYLKIKEIIWRLYYGY